MGKDLRVIVSHPARQAFAYHRPMAAERMGIDVKFLTGLYYKPNKFPYFLARFAPAAKRKALMELLELRRIAGLSPENVVTIGGPVLELISRFGFMSIPKWWRIWDRLAARWIQIRGRKYWQKRPTVIHCYMQCCERTLQMARKVGMTSLLEVMLPPLIADKAQMAKWGVSEFDFPDVPSLKRELAEADFVLVQSEFGAATMRAMGFPASRILGIHVGMDTNKFYPRVGERKPGPLRVVFVGQICRRKGVHHLLKAWRDLQLPDAELLLAGNAFAATPELMAAIEDTPNCRALGHLRGQDFLEFYQQADILVHPSFAEGACAAIYEALGCGVPCIISSHSSSAVRSGIEGIVFPVGDVEALKLAILALAKNPARRAEMGVAARKRAEESLSLDAVSRETAQIYRGLGEIAVGGDPDHVVETQLALSF